MGFDPDTVRGSIRVLGYTFSPAQGRRVDNHEKARLLESKVRASRCSCLPGTMKRKVTIAQRAVVPKASWGWLFRRPSKVDVKELEAVFRRLHKKQKLASPHLFSVVRGHRWELRFMAVNELVAVLHRSIMRTGLSLQNYRSAKSGWTGALRKGLLDLGWQERAPWKWEHVEMGVFLALKRSFAEWQSCLQTVLHHLRESWRRSCYLKWQNQPRIDSRLCAGIPFSESRLRELRFASLTSHQIAVCTGAQVSPSKFNVLVSDKQQGCPWCGSWDADWHHVSWGCSRAPRPQQLTLDSCCDVLQSRLGWPSGVRARKGIDTQILEWLAQARQRCLDCRWA